MIQVPSPNCNFVKRTPQKLMARAVSGQLVTSGHVGQIWRRVEAPLSIERRFSGKKRRNNLPFRSGRRVEVFWKVQDVASVTSIMYFRPQPVIAWRVSR